jgi:MFS family permease
MLLWGGVTLCTVAVKSYEGLLVQRFFLGVSEAGVSPVFSLITAMWYKRREQPLRFAVWLSAGGISILIGSLIFYAIGHIHRRLAAWQYQFMIVGCFSCVWGVCLWFLLPDNPLTAFFLLREMKAVALERIRSELIGIENKQFKPEQAKEAFIDPKTYLYMLILFSVNITNGAASGFGSIIVQSFRVCYFLVYKSVMLTMSSTLLSEQSYFLV